jgi:hypothetical protein
MSKRNRSSQPNAEKQNNSNETHNKTRNNNVLIIGAVSSAAAIIIAALITYFGNIAPTSLIIQATQTAEEFHTSVAMTQTAEELYTSVATTGHPYNPVSTGTPISASLSTATSALELTNTPRPVGCLKVKSWTPYRGEAHNIDQNNCWILNDWGVSSRPEGLLLFLDNNPTDQWHGLYTNLTENTDIKLKIKLDELNSTPDRDANIAIGVVNISFAEEDSHLLFYNTKTYNAPIYLSYGQWGLKNERTLLNHRKRDTNDILFSINGIVLDIYIDGDKVLGPLSLGENKKPVFWIGYSIPQGGDVYALISDLEINSK